MTKFGNSEFADKPTNYYNLDMIISVGYRVKSQNGILFRKWATNILKDYMLKVYAVNQKRLEYLEKTIKLIDIANRIDERLEGNDAKGKRRYTPENVIIRDKNDLKSKLQQGLDDMKSNKTYSLDEVFKHIDNL